jgi:hypothetical protein
VQTQHERISLPVSPLGRLDVAKLSPDGKYLVLSTRTRGGVWVLATGKELYLLRGFTSASFGRDGMLYAELPKHGDQERMMVQLSLSTHSARKVSYVEDENTHLEVGRLLEWKNSGKNNWELVVHDVVNNSALWTRAFERDQPWYTSNYGGAEMIFSWKLSSPAGKKEQKKQTALTTEVAAVKDKDVGRLIEVVDDTTGKLVGVVVIEVAARYEGVGGVSRVGNLLYVSSADNRTMLYSMETGKQIRQIFGYVVAVDADSKRICIVNRPDEAIVYDNDGAEIAHFSLGSQLRFAIFEQKGANLVLLTADQKVQTMDLTSTFTSSPTK